MFKFRWFSLITVMAGIALVGLSGSLIKDTIKDSLLGNLLSLRASGNAAPEPIDKPEATTVLVGQSSYMFSLRLWID